MDYTILMSNMGYARGIDGGLAQHLRFAHRHIYCPPQVQQQSLAQFRALIELEDPDLCCLMEIDQGSLTSGRYNQLDSLLCEHYSFFDIESKYGENSKLRSFFLTQGKSNAFMAKRNYDFQKIYFTHGTKRLIYKIQLEPDITLYFAHFSLSYATRRKQLEEVARIVHATPGQVIVMGDFNILNGLHELEPVLEAKNLHLLNRDTEPTFTLHQRRLVLDICLCSPALVEYADLRIIPQPYSDHDALLLKLSL